MDEMYTTLDGYTVRKSHHSEFCWERIKLFDKACRDYYQKYPNSCKTCHATGELVQFDDPSPAGVALSPGVMEFSDPCPDCTEKGLCPRCGEPLDEDSGTVGDPCPECGWDETWEAPMQYECYCWEQSI